MIEQAGVVIVSTGDAGLTATPTGMAWSKIIILEAGVTTDQKGV